MIETDFSNTKRVAVLASMDKCTTGWSLEQKTMMAMTHKESAEASKEDRALQASLVDHSNGTRKQPP